MSQQQNIPDPEIFTKEIEDTIDSLFTPTRKIEIDPVTNEVKEIKREEPPPAGEAAGQGPAIEAPEEELRLEIEGEGDELKIELEDEAQGVSPPAEEQGPILLEEGPAEDAIEKIEHQFNQLYQALLTLEWEITKEDLTSAYEILKNIADRVEESVESRDAALIIATMLRIMEALKEDPEAVSPNAPKALEMGLEALMALVKEKDDPMPETKERVKKAKEFMALVRFGEDAKREREERTAPGPMEAQEPPAPEPIQVAEPTTEVQQEKEEINRERLQAVIEDLSNCVERIIPVQELLSRHKKSQKLYRFLVGIRERIEGSIHVLSEELGLEVPEIQIEQVSPRDIVAGMADETTASQRKERPPFKEVVCTSVGDVKVALLPEEIAYIGPTLGFFSKVSATDGVFPLKALKKWPWSKIRPLLEGELAQMDEKKLCTLTLPILTDLDGIDPDNIETPKEWILLFKDEKGAALPMSQGINRIALDESWYWIPEANEGSKWLGTLTSKDQILKLVSIERIFEAL